MFPDRHYLFPTREAFRYHFEEPPAAPLRHDETKRLRRIMQWDQAQNRNSKDFNAMNSERTELEYQMAPEIVRKDAPFGTDATPNITMKIIGGRQVPVIEKHAVYTNDFAGSRIQPLRPIADKPNHLDPRIHGDNPGGYYHKDVQDNVSPRLCNRISNHILNIVIKLSQPTQYVNKRPDSKDVVRGQYKALPPIQQNRTRNDLSTVFEAESWTDNRNPPLANETEYKQNYFLGKEFQRSMDGYHESGAKEFHHVSENEKQELSRLLRGDVLLPTDPIALSDAQKLTLSKLVCNDLNRFDPKELRDVYLECSQHDKDLRGFCSIEVLDNSLRRHQAFISDLRLIAAQYVDPNYPGRVNYERVLSFIGSVLQANQKGHLSRSHSRPSNSLSGTPRAKLFPPRKRDEAVETDFETEKRSPDRQPKYYMQNGESYQTGSIYRDREVAKLLRLVEQELSKNTYSMDWTRWQNSFYERDRDHRNTLSAAQIKDICYDHKLPLSDSLINRILELCEDNNRDGQYRWSAFMDFLGRVRPSNTGLPMPVSKRPLEYAKHYPEPGPNWPRTDFDTERRGTSPRRDISPRRGDNRPDDRGQTPAMRVPTPKETKELKDPNTRESNSPDRFRSFQSPSYYDRQPLPNLRQNSLSPSQRSHQSMSPTREPYNPSQYQQREMYPAIEDTDNYDKFNRDRNQGERFNLDDGYNRPHGDLNDRRRSYAEAPSGYQPSWQQNVPKRSTSPPQPRRINERDPYRRDERPEDTEYERHWRNWAYKTHREPRTLQRVQSLHNRPKSYADPPRKTSFPKPDEIRRRPYSYRDEIRFGQDQIYGMGRRLSRLQTPLRRNRSVSPVRNMSPIRGQALPITYRDGGQSVPPPNREGQLLPIAYGEPYGNQSYRDYHREQYPHQYDYMERQDNRYNDPQRDGGMNSYRDGGMNSYRDGGMNSYRDGNRQGRGDETPRNREQKIMHLSHQLRNLETQYEVTREGLSNSEKPWLDRYIKMAQALYNSDITNRGSLPRNDVMEIINQYNNAFNLKLDMNRANMLAISPDNLDKSGNIMLRPFLASLSSEKIAYKP